MKFRSPAGANYEPGGRGGGVRKQRSSSAGISQVYNIQLTKCTGAGKLQGMFPYSDIPVAADFPVRSDATSTGDCEQISTAQGGWLEHSTALHT